MAVQNTPQAVKKVSSEFLYVGGFMLYPAIALVAFGLLYYDADVEKIRPEGSLGGQFRILFDALGRFMISIGLVVMPLGLVPTLAGLGLRRMKRWGLWLGYTSGFVWIVEPLILISRFGHRPLDYLPLLMLAIVMWWRLHKLRPYFSS